MRSLLLLTVLLGVALAKPNDVQLKKLTGLLKKLLKKQYYDGGSGNGSWTGAIGNQSWTGESGSGSWTGQSGSGSWIHVPGNGSVNGSEYGYRMYNVEMDTTLFEGLGEEHLPIKIFDGVFSLFKEPLQISKELKDEYAGAVKYAADIISDIADQIVIDIDGFRAAKVSLTMESIAQFASGVIEPLFWDNRADLEPLISNTHIIITMGAVGGTEGAPRDEVGCDFDGDQDEMVECVLNKMNLVSWASTFAFEKAQFLLEADIDGSGYSIDFCDHLYAYFENVSMADKDMDPNELLIAFEDTMACLRSNIQLIRDRIGMRAPEAFPGERDSTLPLPFLLKSQAFLEHIEGQTMWAKDSIYTVILGFEKREDDIARNEKALAHKKKMARTRFLSNTKAYSKIYNINRQ